MYFFTANEKLRFIRSRLLSAQPIKNKFLLANTLRAVLFCFSPHRSHRETVFTWNSQWVFLTYYLHSWLFLKRITNEQITHLKKYFYLNIVFSSNNHYFANEDFVLKQTLTLLLRCNPELFFIIHIQKCWLYAICPSSWLLR